MKLKIVRSKFVEGLKVVQNIVAGKGSLPVLQNVLLEAKGNELKMTTTDLDISIVNVCDCEVIEEGVTTLPVKLLFNSMLKAVEGNVEIEIDDNDKALIKAGSTTFKIAGISVREFPKLPISEDTYTYKLNQALLKEMLRKVSYAASQDDTRRTLKGVLMRFKEGKLTMVATDGRRLAMVEKEVEYDSFAEMDIVLPSKVVQELQRSLNTDEDVLIQAQKSQICFKNNRITIYSKLIEENYPNYMQVIPSDVKESISIDRQLLLDAIDRVSVISLNESNSTKLIFSSGKLLVTSASNDNGEAKDEVPIKYVGDTIDIIFNPSYIMECLKVIDDDEISMHIIDGHSPAMIKCSIPFVYVLMPLRVS